MGSPHRKGAGLPVARQERINTTMDDRQATPQQDAGITGPREQPTGIVRYRKAIAAGAAGAGLSLLLVTGVFAAPPATPGTGTPMASPPASSQPANGTPGTGGPRQQGQQPGGRDQMRGPRGGGGTVTAVSGNTITVAAGAPDATGATTTITVTTDTIYMLGGPDKATTGSLADVKTGSRVHAEGATDSNGNVTAVLVRVEAPRASGEVTAVSGNTITVQGRGPSDQGGTTTINVSSSTQYVTGGPDSTTTASLNDVVAGVRISAEGILNSDGSFNATTVRIDQTPAAAGTGQAQAAPDRAKGPRGDGAVTAVSGNTITVVAGGPNANGATSTITVTSSTVYLVGSPGSVTKGSLGDVQVGKHLHAEGANDGNGNVTAVLIRIDMPPTTTP